MIVSSFQAQYGIRLYSDVFKTMKWDEFVALLSGLDDKTPLGRIVSVRSENDEKIIKHFTREQNRIRNEWRNKTANNMAKETFDKAMKGFEKMLQAMAK